MYCCSLLQNIILRQLFATCTNHVFTTYTGIQKSQLMWDKDGFKIENVRPTFFICVVAFKFPFNFLSLSRSWTWRLAFSIESPLFITCIVAWVNKSISIATKLAQSGFWVFVCATTSGHKSCICNTIDSCRLFLHRVSLHRYLYHRQNMDPRDERSEKSVWSCALLLNITFLKMGFIVVQWENENSMSVVSEKKVAGAVQLKDGTTVDISTCTHKGRVAIYKATIWKFVVSKNCDIRYVIKILPMKRYNGLN